MNQYVESKQNDFMHALDFFKKEIVLFAFNNY